MSNLDVSMKFLILVTILTITLINANKNDGKVYAEQNKVTPSKISKAPEATIEDLINQLRSRITSKKWSWDLSLFTSSGWSHNGRSVNGLPLVYWTCGDPKSDNSSLILSAVHGDEVTPVYFGFRLVEWLKARPELCKDAFIVVAPIVNPDGFLRYRNGTRTNYNKVDLNRNFDTPEWDEKALKLWKERYGSQRRYYPGDRAASEPEIIFQKWLIDEFKPAKILSVHSPLNHLDFDGPSHGTSGAAAMKFTRSYIESCDLLKQQLDKSATGLTFYPWGTFPGSLGNYAGKHKGIPTLTVELPTTNSQLAPVYFGKMEKGLKVFINYQLQDRPRQLAEKN